jgi:hypothetical protein
MIASEHPMTRDGRLLIEQESSIWGRARGARAGHRANPPSLASAYAVVSHSHSDIV